MTKWDSEQYLMIFQKYHILYYWGCCFFYLITLMVSSFLEGSPNLWKTSEMDVSDKVDMVLKNSYRKYWFLKKLQFLTFLLFWKVKKVQNPIFLQFLDFAFFLFDHFGGLQFFGGIQKSLENLRNERFRQSRYGFKKILWKNIDF